MKFRVTKKDFILFAIFAFLLLLLSSVLVVNFYSIGNDGVFYGLNPIKGLLPPYLPVTLLVFFGALISIFLSVSSYIFDKEKGKGWGLVFGEKKEKGYSRWATEKEMKTGKDVVEVNPSDEKLEAAGIPIINNGKKIWVDNGDYHTLILGSTGCGKSESICKPTVKLLGKKGESMIVTDPKGELYKESAETLRRAGYNIVLLNFREPEKGNSWNPLALPYQYYKNGDIDKATELLEDVANNIFIDKKNPDPFWEKQASDYFSGLVMGLFQDADEEEINLNSVNYMSTVGEEKFIGSQYIKEYFNAKGADNTASIFAAGTVNAPSDTKGSVLSVFRSKIRVFSTRDNLSEMLSYSDFDMQKIGSEKTAVFIVIHDEKTTYHSLVTIFVKQCYECLIDIAQKNGGKLKYRTNFLLDEFSNMPPLKDVDSMVSAARSRDIRFLFIIQNFAQLKDVYGDNVAEIIKGNCGNIIYLISTELSALEEISKMCGEVKSKEKDKTASTPLVTVTDLQKMKLGEAIYKRLRTDPFRTQLAPDFDVDWGYEKIICEYPIRTKRDVKLFDIKQFVKNAKGIKDDDMFNNPFQGKGMLGPNPFGPRPPMPGSNIDIDQMMKDIDKRIAEIEAEEKAEQEKLEKEKKNAENKPTISVPELDIDKIQSEIEKEINEPKEEKEVVNIYNEIDEDETPDSVPPAVEEEKPIINVDNDSVVINENVITDDQFFDDFFGDDE